MRGRDPAQGRDSSESHDVMVGEREDYHAHERKG